MSLDNVKLPFLRVRDLPDSFACGVCGFDAAFETRFGPQMVLKVILLKEQKPKKGAVPNTHTYDMPIKGTPAENFLNLSETAKQRFRTLGVHDLKDVIGKIVYFGKETVGAFSSKTVVPVEIGIW